MSKMLQKAFDQAKMLPEGRQDEMAEMLFQFMDQHESQAKLSEQQLAELQRRLDAPINLVPEDEMLEFFRKHTA